jgi:hypothetical protein
MLKLLILFIGLALCDAQQGGPSVNIVQYPLTLARGIEIQAGVEMARVPCYDQTIKNYLDPARRVTINARFARMGMLQDTLPIRVIVKKSVEPIGNIRLGRAIDPQPTQPSVQVNQTHVILQFTINAAGNYYLKFAESSSQPSSTLFLHIDSLDEVQQDLNMKRLAYLNQTVVHMSNVSNIVQNVDSTLMFQKIINSLQGKTLFVPAGLYHTKPLIISNLKQVSIYLEAGAVIRGTDSFLSSAQGYAQQSDTVETIAFIFISNSVDISIGGRGMIDANSLMKAAYKAPWGLHGMHVYRSKNVSLGGIMFVGSSSWGLHVNQTIGFVAKNVKWYSGKDVFNIDGSQNCLVSACVSVGIDDALVVKFDGRDDFKPVRDVARMPVKRITLFGNICLSSKSAMKIGTETAGPFSDVSFEQNHVIDGDRGIVIVAVDGGSVTNATFSRNRMWFTDWPSESRSGMFFQFCNGCMGSKFPNGQPRPIKPSRVTAVVDGLWTNVIQSSLFEGQSKGSLNLVIKNAMFDVQQPKKAVRGSRPFMFTKSNDKIQGSGVNVRLQDSQIRWNGKKNQWRVADAWLQQSNVMQV